MYACITYIFMYMYVCGKESVFEFFWGQYQSEAEKCDQSQKGRMKNKN